ncbi:MAG: VanW family protein [Firmicutes bacterium]|nr:VanW family protein [Bacillota bacterium]
MNTLSKKIIAIAFVFVLLFLFIGAGYPQLSIDEFEYFACDEVAEFEYALGGGLDEIQTNSETAEYIFKPYVECEYVEDYNPSDTKCNASIFNSQFCSVSSKINITLLYAGQFFEYVDKEIRATDHLVAIDIFERRINGTYEQKLERIKELILSGASVKTALDYCFPTLNQVIDYTINKVSKPPINATIKFDPNSKPMFEITGDRDGKRIDELALYGKIYSALKQKINPVINIDTIPVKPDITYADCIKATHLRTRFSTDFSKSSAGRRNNIKLALSKINGSRLDNGQEFSFNNRVGARSQANGFEVAKIILDGQFVEGVGGGVCQVSTTLYNAVVRADLKITHAVGHSLPISYVAPSFDAMVSSQCDLTFVNSGTMPVFIKCFAKGDRAIVEIYGTPLPYTIRPKSVVTGSVAPPQSDEIIDFEGRYTDGLESGEKIPVKMEKDGLKSEGYLYYYNARGELIKKVRIRRDIYKGIKGLYAVAP